MKIFKRVILVIIILILLIIAIIAKIAIDSKVQKDIAEEENVIVDSNLKILENRNIFYTISTCIDKYTNYISENDTNSLIDILNNEYKDSKKITNYNVMNFVDEFNVKQINVVRKIYEQEIDRYNSVYYVYYTSRDDMSSKVEDGFFGEVERSQEKDRYIIIKLDFSNETFSIIPYNGEIFR